MKTIKIGGMHVVLTGTPAQDERTEAILRARGRFMEAYCREKGWPTNPADLSITQILDIRAQPGWKEPAL